MINNTHIDCKHVNGIVDEDIYHPAISFNFNSREIEFTKQKRQNKFNFFIADYTSINNSLKQVDWLSIFNNLNINEAGNAYYNKIKEIINEHTPITNMNPTRYPIWYSKQLNNIVNEKEYYFELKKNTKNPTVDALYQQKRREYKRLKTKCLYEYETNIESKLKSNTKCFFAYTKSLRKSNFLPPIMKYNDQSSENLLDTSNLFAKYFASVYTDSTSATLSKQLHKLFSIID